MITHKTCRAFSFRILENILSGRYYVYDFSILEKKYLSTMFKRGLSHEIETKQGGSKINSSLSQPFAMLYYCSQHQFVAPIERAAVQ
jgi:hypothetical protein